ncbi:hypothetical protein HG536_0F00480 [Torulaspora globosa]|uniref:Uncharacterized protein n=1 Tax=Torulaspora globosa TaxID=48254 RepID=A0A7G3ZJN8_9SACH|nr:uncharacterized protein HG536_0F00480 [Torulaspora globosa]QLL33724.1 hypothetical protein HG536_0F00480 [Torulaspora globosa]
MTRETVELHPVRSPETESFLKRVEEYDSQRRSASKSKPPLKEKPDRLKCSFPEESIEKARRLLEGESPRELDRMRSTRNTFDAPSSELAYKSAYNYEKSFSPPRKHHSLAELGLEVELSPLGGGRSGKTFVVSEEDFLLLQRLKSSKQNDIALLDQEAGKKDYPSRGRPRNEETTPPSFPIRPRLRDKLQIPDDEAEAPSLPARKYRGKMENSLLSGGGSQTERPAKESPVSPPKRKDARPEQTRSLAPPPVSPKHRGTIDYKNLPKNQYQHSANSVTSSSSTFIDSLEKNKLTVISQVSPIKTRERSPVFRKDFVDSVHLSPKLESTLQLTSSKVSLPIFESDSFIKSAIKTTGTSPTGSCIKAQSRPALPKKPIRLQNVGDEKAEDKHDSREENEINNTKLKAIEKPKPKVPVKKDTLVIPKLRPVTVQTRKNENSTDSEVAQLASPKTLKKVEVSNIKKREAVPPEALIKMNQLNRSTSPSRPHDHYNEQTEALAKLGRLRKLKDAPPVPKRNISLPEALKKAEMLRNMPNRGKKLSPEQHFRNELNSVLKTPRSEVTSEVAIRDAQIHPTSHLDSGDSAKTLIHPNKTRSRGPKRKLPTKVS